MRRYRANLKLAGDKYEEAKEKDRVRKKENYHKERQEVSKSKRKLQEYRSRKAAKQKAYRQRCGERLAAQQQEANSSRQKTVAQSKKIRKQNALRKEKERDKQKEAQQKKKLNVSRTQKWRLRVSLERQQSESATISLSESTPQSTPMGGQQINECSQTPFSPKSAEWRALKRVRENMPKTPIKKATLVAKLAESPRCSKILTEKQVLMSPEAQNKLEMGELLIQSLASSITDSKPHGGLTAKHRLEYGALTSVTAGSEIKRGQKTQVLKNLKIHKRTLKRTKDWATQKRKLRKDRMVQEVRNGIRDFYQLSTVSRISPNKKDVVKVKKPDGTSTEVQKQVMTMTVAQAYELYQELNPGIKVSLTSFRMLKPQNVRHLSETNRRSCLCTTWCNMALKSEALVKFLTREKYVTEGLPTNKQQLAGATLCSQEKPAAACLDRSCASCGVSKLNDA